MRAQDLIDLLRTEPFVPFTLFMTDGTRYDIFHPAFVIVDHTKATIGLPTDQSPDRPAERTAYAALIHVVRIEPVPTKARPRQRS